jgi:cytochrome c2
MTLRSLGIVFATTSFATICIADSAHAADVGAGRTFFREQCLSCHSAEDNDHGGEQGPDLHGLFGRRAGGNPFFRYTPAMKNAKLTWDAATLERFLASPTTVLPGSSMVAAVMTEGDRANVIAYFRSLNDALAPSR